MAYINVGVEAASINELPQVRGYVWRCPSGLNLQIGAILSRVLLKLVIFAQTSILVLIVRDEQVNLILFDEVVAASVLICMTSMWNDRYNCRNK